MKEFINELINDKLYKSLKEADKEDVVISLVKKNDNTKVKLEGSTMAILLSLAGLEKHVIKELNVPEGLFETIKEMVGVKCV